MRPVIIAGSYRQAVDWCRDNDINPKHTLIITSDKDAYRLQGQRFTAEDVYRIGTWYENRMTEVTAIVNHIIKIEDYSAG